MIDGHPTDFFTYGQPASAPLHHFVFRETDNHRIIFEFETMEVYEGSVHYTYATAIGILSLGPH